MLSSLTDTDHKYEHDLQPKNVQEDLQLRREAYQLHLGGQNQRDFDEPARLVRENVYGRNYPEHREVLVIACHAGVSKRLPVTR